MVDIDLLAIMVLVIILFRAPKKRSAGINQTTIFFWLLISVITMLVADVVVWAINGSTISGGVFINYWINYFHILVSPTPVILWTIYIYSLAHNDLKKLKRVISVLMMPFLLNLVIMIITLFNDFVFYIDELNFYQRNTGIYVSFAISIIMIVITLLYAYSERKHFRRKTLLPVVSFGLFPLIGGCLQVMFYGTTIVWSLAAMALLVLYIFIEFNEMNIDYLTGLPSRRRVDDYIHSEMKNAQSGKSTFALLMIDLDGFKNINDTYGHPEGDHALMTFSNILVHSTKRVDMVARFAGDEFLVVLHLNSHNDIEKVINRIQRTTDAYNKKKVVPYELKYSIGYLQYDPKKYQFYKDVLKEVDSRMYTNKENKQ